MEIVSRYLATNYQTTEHKPAVNSINLQSQKMTINDSIVRMYYKLLCRNDIFRKRGQQLVDIWEKISLEFRKRERKLIRTKLLQMYLNEFKEELNEKSWGIQQNKDYNRDTFMNVAQDDESINDDVSQQAEEQISFKYLKKELNLKSDFLDTVDPEIVKSSLEILKKSMGTNNKVNSVMARKASILCPGIQSQGKLGKQGRRFSLAVTKLQFKESGLGGQSPTKNSRKSSVSGGNFLQADTSGNKKGTSIGGFSNFFKKNPFGNSDRKITTGNQQPSIIERAQEENEPELIKQDSIENQFKGYDLKNATDKKEILELKNTIYKYLSTNSNIKKIRSLSESAYNENNLNKEEINLFFVDNEMNIIESEGEYELDADAPKIFIPGSNPSTFKFPLDETNRSKRVPEDLKGRRSIESNRKNSVRDKHSYNMGMSIYEKSNEQIQGKYFDITDKSETRSIKPIDIEELRKIKATVDRTFSPTRDIQKSYCINKFFNESTRTALLNKINDNINLVEFIKDKKESFNKTQEKDKNTQEGLSKKYLTKVEKYLTHQKIPITTPNSYDMFKSNINSPSTTMTSQYRKNLKTATSFSRGACTAKTTRAMNYMDESNVSGGFRIGTAVLSNYKISKMNSRSWNRNLKNKITCTDALAPNSFVENQFPLKANKDPVTFALRKTLGTRSLSFQNKTEDTTQFEKSAKRMLGFSIKNDTYRNLATSADRLNIFKFKKSAQNYDRDHNPLVSTDTNVRVGSDRNNDESQKTDLSEMKKFTAQLKSANTDKTISRKNVTESAMLNGQINQSITNEVSNFNRKTISKNHYNNFFAKKVEANLKSQQTPNHKFTKVVTERFLENTTKLAFMKTLQQKKI